MNIKPKNHLRHIRPVRHAKNSSKSYRRNIFTTKLRGRPFESAGEGGLAVYIYFQSFADDNIYFHPTSAQTIYYLNLMDAGLFIYFLRDQGKNIYFQVFDGQPPPPRINCSSPNKTRDQFQPYPNSTDCHTKHIATGFGLVIYKLLKYYAIINEYLKKN